MSKLNQEPILRVLLAVTVALPLVIAGCGGDDDDDGGIPPATSTPVVTNTVAPPPTQTPTEGQAQPTATPTRTRTNTSGAGATATPSVTPVTETPVTEPPTATRTYTLPPGVSTPTPTATSSVTTTPTTTFRAESPTPPPSTATPTETVGPPPVLRRSSKSSAIAITDDNSLVVMCNPDDDSVSIFSIEIDSGTSGQGAVEVTRVAKVDTGDEPVAVALHPDNRRAFVANRGDATVVEITNLGPEAEVSAPLEVGSEPTGIALSPTGAKLFVAELAEGRVSVVSTELLAIIDAIVDPDNPRAVAVTNDGDAEDDDETLIVTEFFGTPDATECEEDEGSSEACDLGRHGVVRLYNVADHTAQPPRIMFDPIDTGFVPPGGSESVMASPNQLYAAAVQGERVYVTSVSASPQPPINFRVNVAPVVYVGDLLSHQEVRTAGGSANLARLAEDALGDEAGVTDRLFLQELVDLDFAVGTQTAYAISRAADAVQEVTFDSANGVRIGLPQINLLQNVGDGPCQNPIGIAVAAGNGVGSDPSLAFVNCWLTERLAVIDTANRTLVTTVQSVLGTESDQPAEVRRGKRFFFTGRGRWSDDGEGYSSCGSCHPDGLSDGITWSFAAGPRQTTAMDGSFSHGPGPQKARILNWTGIFDELHDFERNTRGVSGGLGAITTSATAMCGTLAQEMQFTIPADGLGQPIKEIQDDPANMICTTDWDDIDEFVKTIRPPRGLRWLGSENVERGRELFTGDGNCIACHAGAGWTVSRRYWTPSSQNNADLKLEPFTPPTADDFWPLHGVQIGPQPAGADNTGSPIAPNEVACTLRNVGTFGVPGDDSATDLIERKADATRTRAQGAGGFNVPSLYGMAVGAPYLHHGQARTLQELFTDPLWAAHLQAANPTFEPDGDDINDLVAFILSIDSSTPEAQVPAPFDACPPVFPAGDAFSAFLSGDQEVPEPIVTIAVGTAVFVASEDEDAIAFDLSTSGLDPSQILQAHIHAAPAGVNGDIIAFLASTSFNGSLRGTITAADLKLPNLAGIDDIADLIAEMETGDTYVNVHTLSHNGGEIRGQIELEE